MSDVYDFLLKFLIVGSAGTGKSCLLYRFLEEKFKSNTSHTIGVEFGSKVIQLGRYRLKLQIWDTAEDAKTLASANIVIIMVGHKSDLETQREVSYDEASEYAIQHDLVYLEASSLTGKHVNEAFQKCASMILTKIEAGDINPETSNSGIQYGNASLSASSSSLHLARNESSSCAC